MLHDFLSANRAELVRRCRAKAVARDPRAGSSGALEHGAPLFLDQLVVALRGEQQMPASAAAAEELRRTAAVRGKELLQCGYSVEQVVHDYGDICQAITEFAQEKREPVEVQEFSTLNRVLDEGIAGAVSSYGLHRDASAGARDRDLHQRMGTLADQQRTLVETALKALGAVRAGKVGPMGATGNLLEDSLVELRDLIDRSLPQIRLSTGMTTPPIP
jgi:hypothetical protein